MNNQNNQNSIITSTKTTPTKYSTTPGKPSPLPKWVQHNTIITIKTSPDKDFQKGILQKCAQDQWQIILSQSRKSWNSYQLSTIKLTNLLSNKKLLQGHQHLITVNKPHNQPKYHPIFTT